MQHHFQYDVSMLRACSPDTLASGWGDHGRFGIEVGYSSWLILAMNTDPVSTSVTSPECAADSIRSADVSLCPFTVLAKGTIP